MEKSKLKIDKKQSISKDMKLLKSKMSQDDYEKLLAIKNSEVHNFIIEVAKLCNPAKIFICSDTPDEIAYIKNMAIVSGEESAALAIPGHTFHFDGFYDQGRDRAVTKFLVPKGDSLSKALAQIDRDEGLTEIKSLFKDSEAMSHINFPLFMKFLAVCV